MNHGLKLHQDGTLEIILPKGKKVSKVLIGESGKQGLYYQYGELIRCSECKHWYSAEPEKVLVAEVKLSKEDIQDAVDNAVEKIRAEMERKKGKWIDDGTELGCCCSECGTTLDDYFDGSLHEICLSKIPNFCPSCGSYNGGEEDEN